MKRKKCSDAKLMLRVLEACINAKGDYYAGVPRTPSNVITVAVDSARYGQRWHAMLDDRDMRALSYIAADNQVTYIVVQH
jgi:hypothetical protein